MAGPLVKSTARDEEFRLAILAAMMPFDDIDTVRQLAILAAVVGQYMAMQDGRKYTGEMLGQLVLRNMEMGNRFVVDAYVMGKVKPTEHPEPPWPIGDSNAKRAGWFAFYDGKARDACPFPPARRDLHADYLIGWDTAAANKKDQA